MKYGEHNLPLVCMQTNSDCYKGTRKMKVLGVLWHSTGANNPYIKRYVQPSDNAPDWQYWMDLLGKNRYGNDWNHAHRQAGLNCWIGKLADETVTTVQTMPWDFRPWGCGSGKNGSCNTGWIQFEICEDDMTNKAYFEACYQEACEITAYLCRMYNINPHGTVQVGKVTVPTILCHWDSYLLGLGGGHGDVYTWFKRFNKNMEDVRNDVAALLAGQKPVTSTSCDYQVRVVVNDGSGLNCRLSPVNGAILNCYPNGTVLHITEVKNNWGYTGEGWVSLAYTAKIEEKEEIDLSKDELQKMIDEAVEKAVSKQFDALSRDVYLQCHPVYDKVADVPVWYQPTIQKLVNAEALKGTGEIGEIDVSEDFSRIMTVLDRLGVLGR